MERKTSWYLFAGISFLLPAIFLFLNSGSYLGFADAAEFALVTKIAGIAHAPGFPSYVTAGWLWTKLLSFLDINHVKALILLSIGCTAFSTLLMYQIFCKLIYHIYKTTHTLSVEIISCFAASSFFTGITAWHWSSNVEVYTFHILAFAMLLYGLTLFTIEKNNRTLYIAALGAGIGLGNHHLTMILFLPFTLFFFTNPHQIVPAQIKSSKKSTSSFNTSAFLVFVKATGVITFLFYGWMFLRASADLPFRFGSPDSFSRLIYHLAGGAWIKNTQQSVDGIVALRFPYFMKITFEQLFLFLPLIILGIIELMKLRVLKFIYIITGYYLLVLLYQLRIDQTSDTDAYMLPAFFLLTIAIPFGAMRLFSWNKNLIYIIPILTVLQIYINFPKTDKRSWNVSETLMHELDRSAPKGSVILIADWTTVIQYYYFRIAENFRPDLIVLNYDLKFTHFKMLPVLYPEFYKEIQPEYDRFIELLGIAHPQEIYNTGCSLDNTELLQAYINTVSRIKKYAEEHSVHFMSDPKSFIFLTQYDLMKSNSVVSGSLVSTSPTGLGEEFLKLDYKWLNSPLLLKEPAASDKLVDLEAALDFNKNYFNSTGNKNNADLAEASYQRIKSLQRKMKRNMPFVYRPK